MPFRKRIINGKWNGSYVFYLNFLGHNWQQVVRIKPSAVQAVCKRWEDECIKEYCNPSLKAKLFEKITEFLMFAKKSKKKIVYQQYKFTLNLLKEFIKKDMSLNEFKKAHIQDYIIWRRNIYIKGNNKKEVGNICINRDISRISHFFNFCIEREYYKGNNPTFKTKLKESDRFIRITKEQVEEMFQKANPTIKTILMLGIYSGLRPGEIMNLRWNYVDFENKLFHLPAEICKGHKERIVNIPDVLIDYLKSLKSINIFSEYVLTHNNKKVNTINWLWDRYRKKLSFQKLSNGLILHLHDLRHHYAQILKDHGVPISDISSQLGHTGTGTAEKKYANMSPLYIRKRIEILNDYLDNSAIN